MKLDRTTNGLGKYAAINMRKILRQLTPIQFFDAKAALDMLHALGVLEEGAVGEKDEFFLIKLKDKYAETALNAYAAAAAPHDPEYAAEVYGLAQRAYDHPQKKVPD